MMRKSFCAALIAVMCLSCGAALAATFNYHGSLLEAGKPAEGDYDLELTLYSSAEGAKKCPRSFSCRSCGRTSLR